MTHKPGNSPKRRAVTGSLGSQELSPWRSAATVSALYDAVYTGGSPRPYELPCARRGHGSAVVARATAAKGERPVTIVSGYVCARRLEGLGGRLRLLGHGSASLRGR